MESKDCSSEPSLSEEDKKQNHDRQPTELNDARERGRLLRSAHKRDVMLSGQFGSLSLDSRVNLPQNTGLVYDSRLAEHRCVWDPEYVECPQRITQPYQKCVDYGLAQLCQPVQVREASDEEIELEHNRDYIAMMKNSQSMSEDEHKELAASYDTVFFHPTTFACASLCLGGVLNLVDGVVSGKLRNGMAIVRPPGHHAGPSEACGFCYFNNVAIAAKYAQQKHGVQRVLILDWDVHHGQATQRIFYTDPSVLYISMHRYEHGAYWPNLRESDYDHVGRGKGLGHNVNIPLNTVGLGDNDYIAFFHQIILPIAYEFMPDLILVSAGYDCALGCPEGEMEVSPATFALFTHMMMGLADGRICVIQEGGYCIQSLSEGIAFTVRALLGQSLPSLPSIGEPKQSAVETIVNVITVQRPYWKCFQYQTLGDETFSSDQVVFNGPAPPVGPVKYSIENPQPPSPVAAALEVRLNELSRRVVLLSPPHRTSLVYDDRMRAHKNHVNPGHPERPDRITRIYAKHEEYGLVARCHLVAPRFATKEELASCHPRSYIDEVEQFTSIKPRDLHQLEERYDSVYLTQEAYQCACLSVGCLLSVLDSVLSGQSNNGVAIIRPPGHHAEPELACGFCFFNNVAVAARYSQQTYNVERVLIVDWDIHHGNGTQRIFENDPSVLYISIHRYEDGGFFPGGDYGNYTHAGSGRGEGFNINVAWNKKGMGNGDYISAFQQIVMPIAREFNPDLVLISAGFDAARGDPLGGCHVTPACYATMTRMLCSLAQGRVVMALEGGYNLSSLSESMALCTCVLLGDPCPPVQYSPPCPSAVQSITDTLDVHQKYWKSLKYRVSIKRCSRVVHAPGLSGLSGQSDLSGLSDLSGDLSPDLSSPEPRADYTSDIDTLVEEMGAVSVEDWSGGADGSYVAEMGVIPPPRVLLSTNDPPPTITSTPSSPGISEAAPPEGGVSGCVHHNGDIDAPIGAPLDGACDGAWGGAEPQQTLLIDGLEPEGFVMPLPWCPHLALVKPMPADIDVKSPCITCASTTECWLCLTCYQVYCGRYVNRHMVLHGLTAHHYMVLSYADLSVWCYGCEKYVNNEILFPVKRAAHINKFNVDVPCYFY